MQDKIGICQGIGQTICSLHIGTDVLDVSKNGRKYNTLLNHKTVIESKSDKELMSKALPVINAMAKSMCKQAKIKEVRISNNNLGVLVDNLLKNIKDNMGTAEVFVLEGKPDESTENTMPEVKATKKLSLNTLCEDLPQISETIDNARHLSGILLKTSLPKSMWGGKEVSAILNGVKSDMDSMSFSALESSIEQSEENINHFQSSFIDGKVASHNIPVVRFVAGKIIDNFSTVKTATSELTQNLHRLYDIDSVFKKATGYPATWFLNTSVFYDFNFEYDNLVDHLVRMAKTETDAIEPLLVWKIKTGE